MAHAYDSPTQLAALSDVGKLQLTSRQASQKDLVDAIAAVLAVKAVDPSTLPPYDPTIAERAIRRSDCLQNSCNSGLQAKRDWWTTKVAIVHENVWPGNWD